MVRPGPTAAPAAVEGTEAVVAAVVAGVTTAVTKTGTACRKAGALRGPMAAAGPAVDPTRGTKSSEAIDIILKYVRTWVHPNSG